MNFRLFAGRQTSGPDEEGLEERVGDDHADDRDDPHVRDSFQVTTNNNHGAL